MSDTWRAFLSPFNQDHLGITSHNNNLSQNNFNKHDTSSFVLSSTQTPQHKSQCLQDTTILHIHDDTLSTLQFVKKNDTSNIAEHITDMQHKVVTLKKKMTSISIDNKHLFSDESRLKQKRISILPNEFTQRLSTIQPLQSAISPPNDDTIQKRHMHSCDEDVQTHNEMAELKKCMLNMQMKLEKEQSKRRELKQMIKQSNKSLSWLHQDVNNYNLDIQLVKYLTLNTTKAMAVRSSSTMRPPLAFNPSKYTNKKGNLHLPPPSKERQAIKITKQKSVDCIATSNRQHNTNINISFKEDKITSSSSSSSSSSSCQEREEDVNAYQVEHKKEPITSVFKSNNASKSGWQSDEFASQCDKQIRRDQNKRVITQKNVKELKPKQQKTIYCLKKADKTKKQSNQENCLKQVRVSLHNDKQLTNIVQEKGVNLNLNVLSDCGNGGSGSTCQPVSSVSSQNSSHMNMQQEGQIIIKQRLTEFKKFKDKFSSEMTQLKQEFNKKDESLLSSLNFDKIKEKAKGLLLKQHQIRSGNDNVIDVSKHSQKRVYCESNGETVDDDFSTPATCEQVEDNYQQTTTKTSDKTPFTESNTDEQHLHSQQNTSNKQNKDYKMFKNRLNFFKMQESLNKHLHSFESLSQQKQPAESVPLQNPLVLSPVSIFNTSDKRLSDQLLHQPQQSNTLWQKQLFTEGTCYLTDKEFVIHQSSEQQGQSENIIKIKGSQQNQLFYKTALITTTNQKEPHCFNVENQIQSQPVHNFNQEKVNQQTTSPLINMKSPETSQNKSKRSQKAQVQQQSSMLPRSPNTLVSTQYGVQDSINFSNITGDMYSNNSLSLIYTASQGTTPAKSNFYSTPIQTINNVNNTVFLANTFTLPSNNNKTSKVLEKQEVAGHIENRYNCTKTEQVDCVTPQKK